MEKGSKIGNRKSIWDKGIRRNSEGEHNKIKERQNN
jgi:hypothetical protein